MPREDNQFLGNVENLEKLQQGCADFSMAKAPALEPTLPTLLAQRDAETSVHSKGPDNDPFRTIGDARPG